MTRTHAVLWNGKQTGTVCLTKEGLYYRVQCSCKTVDKQIYRLAALCGDDPVRLGVLIPEGDEMMLQTKIPVKKLKGEDPQFQLECISSGKKQEDNRKSQGKFIPIYPDEPYSYLSKLKSSYLEIRKGEPGIVITE